LHAAAALAQIEAAKGMVAERVAAIWTRDGKSWQLQPSVTKDQLPWPDVPAIKDSLVLQDA